MVNASRNVEFVYLYRDGSNYKALGAVVFSNKNGRHLEELRRRMQLAILSEQTFVAHQVRVPELFLYLNGELTHDDHCFHEFHELQDTETEPTDELERSIEEFLNEVETQAAKGWRAFEPAIRAGRPRTC